MDIQNKLMLAAFFNKKSELKTEYGIVGSTYLILAGLISLQEKGYLKINLNKDKATKIYCNILKDTDYDLSAFDKKILKLAIENPSIDDIENISLTVMRNSPFAIATNDLISIGLVEELNTKFLFINWKYYRLTAKGAQSLESIVQDLRVNLLENRELDLQTIAFILLLDKIGELKKYFANFERKEFLNRLENIKSTNSEMNEYISAASRHIDHMDLSTMLIIGAAG